MSDIVTLKTKENNSTLIYDYTNDNFFLVEKNNEDKLSWSTYRNAKGKVALFSLLCVPLFLIIRYINVPIILLYLLAFYLKKYVKQLYIDPFTDNIKSKHWKSIDYEQASEIVDDFNIVNIMGIFFIPLILCSFMYYINDLEMKFISLIGIIGIGAIFFAYVKGLLICYKITKRLKRKSKSI